MLESSATVAHGVLAGIGLALALVLSGPAAKGTAPAAGASPGDRGGSLNSRNEQEDT
jgi:hypothetical protein